LAQHSLHVAEEILELIEPGPLRPKGIIAALAHDIGKTPRYHDKLYSMGDHPIISVAVLDQIEGFKKLPYAQDIMDAVKIHHQPTIDTKNHFATLLRKADQNARRKEVSQKLESAASEISMAVQEEQAVAAPVAYSQTIISQRSVSDEELAASRALMGTGEPQLAAGAKKPRPNEVALPWFDADKFLAELMQHVNLEKWGKFQAFSMVDGTVFVQPALIWDVAKKLAVAVGDMTVGLGDSDKKFKSQILFSIVQRLATEKEAVCYGLIKEGYYSGPFTVSFSDGNMFEAANYTPLYAAAFGVSVSDFEARKGSKIKGIVEVRAKR
jgi:hypothetical protein